MKQPIPYVPRVRVRPGRVLDVGSAWLGIESILFSLLDEFQVRRSLAVELGVEYGYSAAALANYFGYVIGVDTFTGLGHDENFADEVRESLRRFPNVTTLQMDWKQFANADHTQLDLIHIDMDHNYEQTFEAGEWAISRAPVVLFHDTESWKDGVGRACGDLAEKHDLFFYNYEHDHGLGILTRREKR